MAIDRHRRITASLLLGAALVIALPLSSLSRPAHANGFKQVGGLRVLGRLPEPTEDGITVRTIVQVDPARRLMYYLWRRGTDFYLREYDLRPTIPQLARETYIGTYGDLQINSSSPYTMQLDTTNRRLLLLGQSPTGSTIRVVDLRTFKLTATWDIASIAPGFVAQGMTYAPQDGRIYLVGSESGNAIGSVNAAVNKPAQATAVVALDVTDDPADGATLGWAKPIPQCQQVMDTYTVGALIARSKLRPALYFACVRAEPWTGESGVVRLTIKPTGKMEDAPGFPVEFFPVSGSYTDATRGIVGLAAFDYSTDRFFMQSLAFSTPGTWVLDGRLSAWAGFIAAPDSSNWYLGLDQRSGHFYMAGTEQGIATTIKNGFMLVADGRQTPVPQGVVAPGMGAEGFIVTDPVTHRLFVPMNLAKLGMAPEGSTEVGMIVIKDETPLAKPPASVDYDSLTTNMPEGPKTVTNFSGDVNGYGARTVLVGGYGGVVTAAGVPLPVDPGLRPGDRGVTAARVPSVDLRPVGAAATAQALLSDTNTDAELHDAGGGEWPWAPASCLNGGGDALDAESTGNGGDARVRCDLTKQNAEAASSYAALSAGPVSIGASSFHAQVWRDPDDGVITQTTAEARGIELAAPDGQTVSIAHVGATATTEAHGLPHTAKATWTRSISGVRVTDADGKVTQELGSCSTSAESDSCADLVTQLNDVLQTKMRIDLPTAVVESTPKGAFAGIQQSDRDFYEGRTVDNQGTTFAGEAASRAVPSMQIKVFNDTFEKSRLLVQLAALQANSIYTNSAMADYDDPTTPPTTGGGGSDTTIPESTAGGVASDLGSGDATLAAGGAGSLAGGGSSGTATAAPVAAELPPGVLAFLTRSPKEALLFAGVWLLFGSAGAAVMRRRALLGVLTGVKTQ